MNCPVCRTSRLTRTRYEGVTIQQCETCEGSLVRNKRLNAIKRSRDKSDHELVCEVHANTGDDSRKKLICPGCLRQMDCRKTPAGTLAFNIEVCAPCGLTWFDAGELAKLQLYYQASDQGAELSRFRERLANMPESEREEFDRRVAKMKFDRVLSKEDLIWLCFIGSRYHRR